MALTLRGSVNATQTYMEVSGSDDLVADTIKALDSEYVYVRSVSDGTPPYGQGAWRQISVDRGFLGKAAASHSLGTTVAAVDVGTGGGGVTVEVPPAAPVAVTNIVAPGAALADGTATLGAFNGCRYAMNDAGSGVALNSGNARWLSFYMNNVTAHYDTDGYAAGGFTDGISNDGYLRAPTDGYYRISAGVRVDWSASDATYVDCIITSPDRDGDWDDVDHFTVIPNGADSEAGLTITHWLAATDRVYVSAASFDGSTAPHATGAIEMQFLGTGTNPAA